MLEADTYMMGIAGLGGGEFSGQERTLNGHNLLVLCDEEKRVCLKMF